MKVKTTIFTRHDLARVMALPKLYSKDSAFIKYRKVLKMPRKLREKSLRGI